MSALSYADFCQAHNLPPLVDIKTACRIAALGHSKFYLEVQKGTFTLVPHGSRRFVTAANLHAYYVKLLSAAEAARAA